MPDTIMHEDTIYIPASKLVEFVQTCLCRQRRLDDAGVVSPRETEGYCQAFGDLHDFINRELDKLERTEFHYDEDSSG